jgi:NAD-dependent dihydropyrimidine dehydrogenase PreA subunit
MAKVVIDEKKCTGCGACTETCPSSVFEMKGGLAVVKNEGACVACRLCVDACPAGAITVED